MSGVFENQDAAVVQMDFGCFPCLAYFFAKASKHTLVVAIWIGIGWIPGTVEPVACGGDSRLEDTRQKTKRAPRRSLASTPHSNPPYHASVHRTQQTTSIQVPRRASSIPSFNPCNRHWMGCEHVIKIAISFRHEQLFSATLLRQGYEGHSSLPSAFQWPAIRSFRHGSEEWRR